mgnify:CR=1 FL=1
MVYAIDCEGHGVKAKAATQDSFVSQFEGKPNARLHIVLVRIVKATMVFVREDDPAFSLEAGGGDFGNRAGRISCFGGCFDGAGHGLIEEINVAVVPLRRRAFVFVANAQIERQPVIQLEIILEVRGIPQRHDFLHGHAASAGVGVQHAEQEGRPFITRNVDVRAGVLARGVLRAEIHSDRRKARALAFVYAQFATKFDAVIARVPFDEGTLSGAVTKDSTWPEGDWRNTYFVPENLNACVTRAEAVFPLIPDGMSKAEFALRFILHNPTVSTIIPGMRKLKHVDANIAVSDDKLLPQRLVMELKKHRWDRKPTKWSQ